MQFNSYKKVFHFPKIAFYGGRKINAVDVEVSLKRMHCDRNDYDYYVFTACGDVWNATHTDIVCGGQCLDDILPFMKASKIYQKIYKYWKLYHLNNMKAGNKAQEEALKEFRSNNRYDYTSACNFLKEKGLYETPLGKRKVYGQNIGENDLYRYGSGWVIEEIPEDDLKDIIAMLSE